MKNVINKLLLVFVFMMFFIPNNVNALLMKETQPIVNTFTIATNSCTLTKNYYYVDENDVRSEIQAATSNTYTCGDAVILDYSLLSNIDYSMVKYYIGNTEISTPYTINSDVTIDEVYYLNRYTITYNLNNGTLVDPKTSYTNVTPTFDLPTPTRSGYTFLGWSVSNTITGSQGMEDFSTEMVINNVYDTGTQGNNHIYLRVTSGTAYVVNVDYNGTDRIMVYTEDVNSVVQYSINNSTWTTISNWVTEDNIEYQYFTLSNGSFDPNSGIADPGITYNEFLNAISGGSVTVNETINPYTVNQGSTGNITVEAEWRANQTYTLSLYRGVNNNETPTTQTFVSGESQAIIANPFTRNRYTFIGWGTTRNGSVVYTDEEEITLTRNMSLYAIWQRN